MSLEVVAIRKAGVRRSFVAVLHQETIGIDYKKRSDIGQMRQLSPQPCRKHWRIGWRIRCFAEPVGNSQKREIGDLDSAPRLFIEDERQIVGTPASGINHVPVVLYYLPADKYGHRHHEAYRQRYYEICFALLLPAKFRQAGHNRILNIADAGLTHATVVDAVLPPGI